MAAASTATASADEIRQLRDALRGMLGTAEQGAPPAPDAGWRSGWPALAEMGVTSFCVGEEKGGFGLDVRAAAATASELGAALHASPYAGLVAATRALSASDDPVAAEVLPAVLAGERVAAFGRIDHSGRVARVVDGAPDADLLVLARPGDDELVLLTDGAAWSVDTSLEGFDVSRTCGDVTVDPSLARPLGADPVAVQLHRLLLAADAVGCVRRMVDRTVAYAGERVAFGRPIGGFQAVQHRLADHAVRARGMALAVDEAAGSVASASPGAARAVAVAEVAVSASATRVLHDLLQLTGAIGFTWEYGLHFFERRVHHDARLAANPRAAVRALATIEGWTGAR